MCILFYHAKKFASPGKFRLILISNRDEYLKRPTKRAQTWTELPEIFAGRDLQVGVEGGTWLAVNRKSGRLATLLNLADGAPNPKAVSRGHLVVDFLKDASVSGRDYTSGLASKAEQHNPFHLVTFELMREDLKINYFAHLASGGSIGPVDLSPTGEEGSFQSVSNAPLATPLKKSEEGLKLFKRITEKLDNTSMKDELVESLFSLAKTDTKFWPDPVLSLRTDLEPHLKSYSSIFVQVPEKNYGTRTHTVILVDDEGKLDFYESTLFENNTGTLEWMDTHECFSILT